MGFNDFKLLLTLAEIAVTGYIAMLRIQYQIYNTETTTV
jgi:hypothetical protein